MTASAPRSDAALSLALHLAARRVEEASRPVVDALGIGYEGYLVLARLWTVDGTEEGQMGPVLGLLPVAVSEHVGALVARGYVERVSRFCGPVQLWLTDEGHRARAVTARALDHRSALDDADLADTCHLLDALVQTLA